MALRTLPLRSVYEAVDWPVIVLLGALLPVAGAMQNTGAADLIARLLLENVAQGNALVGLAVVMLTTMVLTDFMNNAETLQRILCHFLPSKTLAACWPIRTDRPRDVFDSTMPFWITIIVRCASWRSLKCWTGGLVWPLCPSYGVEARSFWLRSRGWWNP